MTMKKEEIYLDLSKLSESERKEVFELLPAEKYTHDYSITFFCDKLCFNNYWKVTNISNIPTKTEITFNQFKELFNSIQLDKTKAYDLRDLNEEQLTELIKHLRVGNNAFIFKDSNVKRIKEMVSNHLLATNDFYYCWGLYNFNHYHREVINALTLFEPQLKIGDTFEHNGFICEVKSVKNEHKQ